MIKGIASGSHKILCGLSIVYLAAAGGPLAAQLESGAADSLSPYIASLPTGEQLTVAVQSGQIDFAGRDLHLEDFSGVFGYASELAYVLVIDGRASSGGTFATRGQMLMIQPFGADVGRAHFDAARLHTALAPTADPQLMPTMDSLSKLADRQATAMFIGRLAPSNFNIATLGSASDESERRARIGGPAVRAIRFSDAGSEANAEGSIVAAFMTALAEGDVATVAEFLDPLPYGYASLDGRAGRARSLMAQKLFSERDWTPFGPAKPIKAGDTIWSVTVAGAEAIVRLRRTVDFAYVESVEVGAVK